jgi:hypothetical protein
MNECVREIFLEIIWMIFSERSGVWKKLQNQKQPPPRPSKERKLIKELISHPIFRCVFIGFSVYG